MLQTMFNAEEAVRRMVASEETLLNHNQDSMDGGVTMLMVPGRVLFLNTISSPKVVQARIIKGSDFLLSFPFIDKALLEDHKGDKIIGNLTSLLQDGQCPRFLSVSL